jgi:hypothetical protein
MSEVSYVYHYSASQTIDYEVSHVDGLITCDIPIDNMERYLEVKLKIVQQVNLNPDYSLVLHSLTRLH